MSKFELDNDWDVDAVAETLNTSLFGNSEFKSKKRKPNFKKSTTESFLGNLDVEDDDEKLSKKDKKRLKNKKRRMNKEKDNSNHVENAHNNSKLKKSNHDVKIIMKNDAVLKNDGETKKKSKIKEKKKRKDKMESSIEKNNNFSLNSNNNSEVKQSRKRKRSENLDSSVNKKKKIKLDQTPLSESKTENKNNTENTDKKRRNRKKKNTSRKNREKHMALKNKPKPSLAVINKDEINDSIIKNSKTIECNDVSQRKNTDHLPLLPTNNSPKKKKLSKEFNSFETTQQNHLLLVNTSSLKNENILNELESSKNKKKKKKSDKDFKNFITGATENGFQKEHVLKKKHDKNVKSSQTNVQDDSEIKAHSDLKKNDKKDKTKKKKNNSDKVHSPVLKTLDLGQSMQTKKLEKRNIGNLLGIKPVDSSKQQIEHNGLKAVQSTEASTNVHSLWSSTSLASQARKKLKSARFRYINEQLYTCTGSEALKMFRTDHDAFKVYHEGYENQVSKWPVNPVDIIIKQIKDKPKNLVIADFGCGDAKLAASIPHTVHSFDLVAVNNRVTACDMSKVPLLNESVDIAVFCLSLMGTNIGDYILEANRVLKTGGLLKIIEVVSRFKGLSEFIGGICKRGFLLLNKRDVNEMFYQLNFKKVSTVKKSSSLGVMTLKPCVYKKR